MAAEFFKENSPCPLFFFGKYGIMNKILVSGGSFVPDFESVFIFSDWSQNVSEKSSTREN